MIFRLGRIFGAFYQKVRNSRNGQKAEHYQVQFGTALAPGDKSSGDVKTVQRMGHAGFHSSPLVSGGHQAISAVVSSGEPGALLFSVAEDDFIQPSVQPGETEIYATDGFGVKLGRIQMRASGLIYIGTQSLTYNLRTALDNLIAGIQGMTCVNGSPPVDTTGKIATALIQINNILDGSVS